MAGGSGHLSETGRQRRGPAKRGKAVARMIDNFALGLTHLLMMIAAVLLLRRPDLDREAAASDSEPPAAPAPSHAWRRPRRDA